MIVSADAEVRRHFGAFGPIAEVKLYRKGSYGFVRYKNHVDAVRAIVGMNGQVGAAAGCCCCCCFLLLSAAAFCLLTTPLPLKLSPSLTHI